MNINVIARLRSGEAISSEIATVPLWTLAIRESFELLLRPFLPRVIVDNNHVLPKVHKAAGDGNGLVIVFTHFSLRDAMEVNRTIIYNDPVLKYREVINPLAYHQYNKFMYFVGKFFHGTLVPIVNNSALSKKGFEHLQKGKGLKEFVELSGSTLSKGGIVTLAVNASRKEKLDIGDPQKPLGYLVASLQAKGVTNYSILLVSFSIKNAPNYSKKEVGGFNICKTYIINLAGYYSLHDLLNIPEINGKVGNVDSFIRKELAKFSPKEYLQS